MERRWDRMTCGRPPWPARRLNVGVGGTRNVERMLGLVDRPRPPSPTSAGAAVAAADVFSQASHTMQSMYISQKGRIGSPLATPSRRVSPGFHTRCLLRFASVILDLGIKILQNNSSIHFSRHILRRGPKSPVNPWSSSRCVPKRMESAVAGWIWTALCRFS